MFCLLLIVNVASSATYYIRSDGGTGEQWNGAIQHIQTVNKNVAAYPSGDSHPSQAGNLKATGQFLDLLNIAYNRWKGISSGNSYYVAKTGDDSNPGSEAQPWLSIQKAANTLVAGDTVYIKAGTYNERVVPQNSGSPNNYITYAAYPGETVTIDGTGVDLPEWTALFDITGKAYIKVSGLRVTNARVNPHNLGIQSDTSSHIIIEKNYVSNTNDSGIGIWSSSDVTVDENEVERPCQAEWNEGISVGGTDVFEVKNNLVHHGPKEGICIKDGSSNGKVFGNEVHHTARVGFYVDAQDEHTYGIEVYGNVSHDCVENGFALASEVGGLLENIKVYNNVAYNNGWCGLQVTSCCVATHPMSNIQIVNNTFYNNGVQWGGGLYIENPSAQGVVIRNNLCSQNLTFQIAVNQDVPVAHYSADHNLIDGFRDDSAEIRGTDYVEGDPQFVNASEADFHLQESSPAIDKGSPLDAPVNDYEGNIRPQGAGYDIGAYEHGAGPPTETVSKPSTPNGSASGIIDTEYSFTTGGATSSLGHSIEYRFDWGDGTFSNWLPVGTTIASKSWSTANNYPIAVQARCATDTDIVSNWSDPLSVNITSNPTLTVLKSGTGDGTVTSSPGGINCGDDCSEVYSPGTKVTLTAKADTNSTFMGWASGGCSGIGKCIVIMDTDTSVTATFSVKIPDISVAQTTLEFGSVKVGKKKTKTLKITNNGTGDLVITLSALEGTDFSIQGSSGVTIKAKKSYSLKLLFTPKSAGLEIATLRMGSNDPDTPIQEISLIGTGQ